MPAARLSSNGPDQLNFGKPTKKMAAGLHLRPTATSLTRGVSKRPVRLIAALLRHHLSTHERFVGCQSEQQRYSHRPQSRIRYPAFTYSNRTRLQFRVSVPISAPRMCTAPPQNCQNKSQCRGPQQLPFRCGISFSPRHDVRKARLLQSRTLSIRSRPCSRHRA